MSRMRWSRLRVSVLAVSAVAGVVSGTQTLGGRPVIPGDPSGLKTVERAMPGGRRLELQLSLGEVMASTVLRVRAGVPVDSVAAWIGERPQLRHRTVFTSDRRALQLHIPIPARDDSSPGMTKWWSFEPLHVAFFGAGLEHAPLVVEDWLLATKTLQDSKDLQRRRDMLWWVYLFAFVASLAGVVTTVAWPEKKAFNSADVVRELIALVEGKDGMLMRRYLVAIVIEKMKYREAIDSLGVSSFSKGRSLSKRALEEFRQASAPLKVQLDDALRRLKAETGTP